MHIKPSTDKVSNDFDIKTETKQFEVLAHKPTVFAYYISSLLSFNYNETLWKKKKMRKIGEYIIKFLNKMNKHVWNFSKKTRSVQHEVTKKKSQINILWVFKRKY